MKTELISKIKFFIPLLLSMLFMNCAHRYLINLDDPKTQPLKRSIFHHINELEKSKSNIKVHLQDKRLLFAHNLRILPGGLYFLVHHFSPLPEDSNHILKSNPDNSYRVCFPLQDVSYVSFSDKGIKGLIGFWAGSLASISYAVIMVSSDDDKEGPGMSILLYPPLILAYGLSGIAGSVISHIFFAEKEIYFFRKK